VRQPFVATSIRNLHQRAFLDGNFTRAQITVCHPFTGVPHILNRSCAMLRRKLSCVGGLVLLLLSAPSVLSATTISVGPRIIVDATTFAVPVDITGGANVIGWQFDLMYDASDVQVNAGCDPFGGDPYCSLITGPVTEGDFFASGAPFNLLVPGVIDLDPVTLAQTGLLFGVSGTFGGSAPFPSGNGMLAFVEFTILGTGTTPITVSGSAISDTIVPEPATLALLATGMLLSRVRRRVGPAILR